MQKSPEPRIAGLDEHAEACGERQRSYLVALAHIMRTPLAMMPATEKGFQLAPSRVPFAINNAVTISIISSSYVPLESQSVVGLSSHLALVDN